MASCEERFEFAELFIPGEERGGVVREGRVKFFLFFVRWETFYEPQANLRGGIAHTSRWLWLARMPCATIGM